MFLMPYCFFFLATIDICPIYSYLCQGDYVFARVVCGFVRLFVNKITQKLIDRY